MRCPNNLACYYSKKVLLDPKAETELQTQRSGKMRMVNFLTALVFALVVCLSAGPVNSFAEPGKKEMLTAEKKTKKTIGQAASKLKQKSVSINGAGKALLIQLPGVGEKTADAIIKYRKANGRFKSIDDLLNVKGIGDKKLSKIKKYLKL
jgi:competence protein ComEA